MKPAAGPMPRVYSPMNPHRDFIRLFWSGAGRAFPAFVFSLVIPSLGLCSGDGRWNLISGGNWADASNWFDGRVAGGTGAVATFETAIGSNAMVTVDTGRTVGTLNLRGSQQWHISGQPLTLATDDGTAPVISTKGTDYHLVSSILSGTQGFVKNGPGGLILRNANAYSGVTTLENGKLYLHDDAALGATGPGNGTTILVSNAGAQLHLGRPVGNLVVSEAITLRRAQAGVSNSIYNDRGTNVLDGALILERGPGQASAVHSFGIQVSADTLTLAGPISGALSAGATAGAGADVNRLQIRTTSAGAAANIVGPVSDGGIGPGGLSLYTDPTSLGVVRLWSASSYSGSTMHAAGRLLVNNVEGSATGRGSVMVKAVLGGTGTIAPGGTGEIAVAGGAVVAPGDPDARPVGIRKTMTLTFSLRDTVGKVSFAPGARLLITLSGAAGTADNLAVNGLAARQPRVYFDDTVVDFAVTGGRPAPGLYTLVDFDADGAYAGRLVLGSGLEGYNATLVHSARSIQLRIGATP